MTQQMLVDRDTFEYWAHAAAFIPMDDYRFSLPYKNDLKNGQTHWIKSPDRNLMGILSPFDNAVIQRDRLKALFDFDYQIECYVPSTKRKYGYFSLPLWSTCIPSGGLDCSGRY